MWWLDETMGEESNICKQCMKGCWVTTPTILNEYKAETWILNAFEIRSEEGFAKDVCK